MGKHRIRDGWKRITKLTSYALLGDRNLRYVFWHHSVTSLPYEYRKHIKWERDAVTRKARKRARRQAKKLEREHMRTLESIALNRGFAGISYTLVHFPSGRVYQGRSFKRVGAHTLGYNEKGYGLVSVGNYETEEPTPLLLAALAASERKGKKWGRIAKDARRLPHSVVSPTACPGKNLRKHL